MKPQFEIFNKTCKIRLLLSLFVCAVFIPAAATSDNVVELETETAFYDLNDSFKILEDKEGKWTIEDISSPDFQNKFVPIKSEYQDYSGLKLGMSSSVWWLKLEVRVADIAATNKNWILNIKNNRFIGTLEFYSPMQNHLLEQTQEKWLMQRPDMDEVSRHGHDVVLKLPVIGKEPVPLYIKIKSDYYMFLPISILTVGCQMGSTEQTSLVDGMFFGVIAVIGVLNLLMFLVLKDRSSLWYVFFVVFMGLYFLGMKGHLSNVTRFLGPMFFAYIHVLGISGIVISSIAFTRSFLLLKEHSPKLDKLLLAYGLLALATALLSPILEISRDTGYVLLQNLTIVLGVLSPLGTIVPGIIRLKQRYKPARLYLVGWSVFSVSAFIFAVPFLGGINGWRIFQIGCATNVVLITLATVDRLRILREQRDAMSRARDTVQKALSESEEKYRNIFDNSPVGIFRVALSDEETLLESNAAIRRIFGYSPDEILPDSLLSTSWVNANDHRDAHRQLEKTGKIQEIESKFKRKDGTHAWCRLSARHYPEKGYFEGTIADITDRKLAEQQLFRAEKMASLGQIIAGVAHEINNPNNFIFFNLPILKKYIDSIKPILDKEAQKNNNLKFLNMPYDMFIEDIYKLLDNMQHGSERITDIVSDLKNYVRTGEAEDLKPESLSAVVSQVMTLVGKQVRKLVKTFQVDLEDDLPLVNMNTGKIEQVLINLVINAGHAADKEDSWVRLTVRRGLKNQDTVEILVEDNGGGIPEENLERIFEPFFTTKGDESGTGLGLAISHKILEDHGGTIEVTSEVGRGTTFTIRLPAALD